MPAVPGPISSSSSGPVTRADSAPVEGDGWEDPEEAVGQYHLVQSLMRGAAGRELRELVVGPGKSAEQAALAFTDSLAALSRRSRQLQAAHWDETVRMMYPKQAAV